VKLLFVFIILIPLISLAEMTIGGELEFVRPSGHKSTVRGLQGYEVQMARRFASVLRARCARLGCTEKIVPGKFGRESRFVFNGFWIQVSYDPNVVEILTKPLKLSRVKQLAPRMQEAIFETARLAGLETSPRRAGHFNFGARSSFENDSELFLKFVIDYSNRPQLASGVLRSLNLATAPPLAALSIAQKQALDDIARLPRLSQLSIADVAEMLTNDVFYKSAREDMDFETAVHNQALGLKKVRNARWWLDQPLEVRAVRSQRSIEDFILLGELFESRIAYLRSRPLERVSMESRIDFTHAELEQSFRSYVEESGLDWNRFQTLMPSRSETMTCFSLFN
jgi:hypothetical protein